MTYTPEPWKYGSSVSGITIAGAPEAGGWWTEILGLKGPERRGGKWSIRLSEEDARRIVACVNACKGIPTEELEKNGLKEASK